jgi:hypothetical protein
MVFLWQVVHNRIQSNHQLKARNCKGGEFFILCGDRDDVNHLLFTCPLSQFIWVFISEVLGWDGYSRSLEEIMADWLPGKFWEDRQTELTCFAEIAWAIWNNRNKMCMSNRFPDSPMCVIFLALSFIQK